MVISTSAGYTFTLRVELQNVAGTLGRLTSAIGRAGADIDAVDLVEKTRRTVVRDISVLCRDERHGEEVVRAARRVHGVTVRSVTDRTFALHHGGKIAVTPRFPVSGLGDVGPLAALPVMEGKAMLFKEFAGIDAYPICVRTRNPDELFAVGEAIEPGFGGINLEDVAAPGCFQVERRLQERLDIPVFHDDQHGTATVVLAALLNACLVVDRPLASLRVVLLGVGAAGIAITRILLRVGVGDLVAVDRPGIVHPGL